MKILIVEDSATDQALLEAILRNYGYNDILKAISPEEAFNMLKIYNHEKPPDVDLILMDIEMPAMSGIEACRQIKLTKHIKDIPVIMITGNQDKTSLKQAFSAGSLGYIKKPVNQAELIAMVHAALKLKQESDIRKKREKELIRANKLLEKEKQKTEKLLKNILPKKIVDNLKETGSTKSEIYKDVTVMFSDIVSFTQMTTLLSPEKLINELNVIFTAFDDIIIKNKCERIKTTGDAFIAVCGMPDKNPDHAENILKAAIEMLAYLKKRNKDKTIKWKIRVGINTGNVIGGIVGIRKYVYDIFGDTVNTAERMESLSEQMKINISDTTFELVKNKFVCIKRPVISVKGKGNMQMYFVEKVKK